MQPVMTEKLVDVAQRARAAKHGQREPIYQAACKELGISRATLLNKLKTISLAKPRKQRTDAGKSNLNRDEAMMISAALIASTRKNGKRLYSIEDAVTMLRSNGEIAAGSVDESTGEFIPLSVSAINRAMRAYGVHPEQLSAPAPAVQLASRHPNHVWQIDASLCVLYYLKNGQRSKESGLQVMAHDVFYKNKPKNLARIANDRVWSYEITDHTTGWIYAEYVMGAESSEHLCSVLINAMQERKLAGDILHGVPKLLYMDPGSAPKAAMTANLCNALGIEILIHEPGAARSTGSVEKARDIIERKFEAALSFTEVNSLDELNQNVAKWRAYFNSTAKHSRYNKTRSECWMMIKHDQLVKAPSVELCRQLAVSAPISRDVNDFLQVKFNGSKYVVDTVPGVLVGQKLMVTRSPWSDSEAQIVMTDENGRQVYHVVKKVEENEFGFSTDSAMIGEDYKQHKQTPAQKTAKEIELLITGTTTETEAKAARKAKKLPFDGRIDPFKQMNDAVLPTYLPKRGQESQILAARIEIPPLSHIEAAKRLIAQFQTMGFEWTAKYYQLLVKRYPEGVEESEIIEVAMSLINDKTPELKLVNH